ncbi:HAD family hydrolase [Nocardiopsis coralliicola]
MNGALGAPSAALFDLDGTLVHSEPRSLALWSRLLDAYGIAHDEAVLNRFTGRRGPDVVAEDPDLFGGAPWAELHERLLALAALPGLPPVRTLPRSADYVRRLHRSGVPIALVTSAERGWAGEALELAGIADAFAGAVTAEDVVRGKPDPEGYLAGARLLGAAPEDVTVFEDTPAGVQAGLSAGMTVVAVTTTHPAAALSAAHRVVDDLADAEGPVRPG